MDKPQTKPQNTNFSSGPCAKRPGWGLDVLADAALGRSHRSSLGKAKLKEAIEKQREILGIPADYKVGIVPASDTGAVEMALWSMLGPRGVDVFAWEVFSKTWAKDITNALKLEDVRVFETEFGVLPDLSQADPSRDIVFTWNGTTSGVRVPDVDWIASNREGITICDATSAVFAYDLDWSKLDVTTWSWQKCLGGEAAHGMIVLSPRAVERLESYTPPWPVPKIFQMTKKGKLIEGIFRGETINTPSMLAVEDCLDALRWVGGIGGLQASMKRARASFAVIEKWVAQTDWIDFLAEVPETRSITSVCLKITDEWFMGFPADENAEEPNQASLIATLCKMLEQEGVAYDIKGHRDGPAHLRIWCGATVEASDVEVLLPWLDWAFTKMKQEALAKAA